MKTGRHLYKCRHCGEIFDCGTVSNIGIAKANFYTLVSRSKPFVSPKMIGSALTPDMHTTHICSDDITGFADIVALKETDE